MSGQVALIEGGVGFLTRTRNADGGWAAYPGGISDSESTALAALALGAAGGRDAVARACRWLSGRQDPSGAWPLSEAAPEAAWATAPAVTALGWLEPENAGVKRGLAWLADVEGARVPFIARVIEWFRAEPNVELDYGVTGWPWVAGTFGWVEPTSLALIAFKSIPGARELARARVEDGERMLLDRACSSGGWNYGNKRVLGADLEAYPDTTALALLALQDCARDAGPIRAALEALPRMLETNDSGLALALGVLCGRAYGRDASGLAARLGARFAASGFLDETRAVALAVLAASDSPSPFLFGASHG